MSIFSEQDPLDPDDPELDYTPLRLRERAAKLGLSVSQGARSEPIRSSPISRPVPPDPKAINEPAMHTRDLDRRAALLSLAARVAAVAGVRHHEACLTAIRRRFNPFRHNGIDEHRSAPVQPRRRRIEARARRVQSTRRTEAGACRVQSAPRATA